MFFQQFKKELENHGGFDVSKIQKAYDFAETAHHNQKRKSGEPFITHPVEVAEIVYQIGGDENMVCAALLHDVLEDGDHSEETKQKIKEDFGYDVFFLVDTLSKDCRIQDCMMRQDEYFERLNEALKMDVSVFFLKMADLIHNLKTIQGLSPEKQKKWIRELREQYIPMMSNHFHHTSFHYDEMYLNLINELESVIEKFEKEGLLYNS
ncbi:HD domain-containing protein [Candidatus Gracilibacteria bacterium]|nr:HD domain-containing protein [Candidatus Gracilibacteria bacterium]